MKIVRPKHSSHGIKPRLISYAEVEGSKEGKYIITHRRTFYGRNIYSCTCPDFIFRQHVCKHIIAFKKAER